MSPNCVKLRYFSKFFLNTEAEHVLKMFLKYPKNRASCSYKLRSYKKKKCKRISFHLPQSYKPITHFTVAAGFYNWYIRSIEHVGKTQRFTDRHTLFL